MDILFQLSEGRRRVGSLRSVVGNWQLITWIPLTLTSRPPVVDELNTS